MIRHPQRPEGASGIPQCCSVKSVRQGKYGFDGFSPSFYISIVTAVFFFWEFGLVVQSSDWALIRAIEKVPQGSRKSYGSPRIWTEVKAMGFQVGKRTVEKLMKENGIVGKKKRRYRVTTTDSKHSMSISPNLVACEFDRGAPNRVWLSDISIARTARNLRSASFFPDPSGLISAPSNNKRRKAGDSMVVLDCYVKFFRQ